MRRWTAPCCLAFGLLCAAPAPAGFRDLDDGWLLEPAEAAALLDGRPAAGTVWRAGTARLYGLPGLDLMEAGLRAGIGNGRLDLAWQRLGGDLWREDRVRASAGRGPLALEADWTGVRAGDLAEGSRLDLRLLLDVALDASWRLRLRSDPVTALDGAAPPAWSPWVALDHRAGGWSAGLRVDRGRDGGAALRLGCTATAGGVLALGALCGPDEGVLGLTTAWRRGGLLVRSSHLVHPALGPTHRWQLAYAPEGGP